MSPRSRELSDKLTAIGLKPFHLPLGILLDQKEDGFATPTSTCIRCTAFDGFPCLLNGKADAQVICIDPMLAKHDNVTLMTNAYVSKLGTDPSGRRVDAVHVERRGEAGDLFSRHGGGCMRIAFLRAAPVAIGERPASERSRQRLRSGWAQLYAPRDEHRHGGDASRQRDGVSENVGVQRFLFRQRRLGLSPRPDPDVRDQPC